MMNRLQQNLENEFKNFTHLFAWRSWDLTCYLEPTSRFQSHVQILSMLNGAVVQDVRSLPPSIVACSMVSTGFIPVSNSVLVRGSRLRLNPNIIDCLYKVVDKPIC